jgi:hypothetical protein
MLLQKERDLDCMYSNRSEERDLDCMYSNRSKERHLDCMYSNRSEQRDLDCMYSNRSEERDIDCMYSNSLSFDLLEYIQSRSLSSDLLEYIQSRSLSFCNSIKTFDFSTRYTTIPNSKLKNKLRELVQLCFIKNNGQRRYKYLVLGRDRSYFVKHHSDSTNKCSETDIFSMLEYLIDNIFAMFSLVDVFFNRQSAYLWVQAVLLFSPTCSFIRMRQTS